MGNLHGDSPGIRVYMHIRLSFSIPQRIEMYAKLMLRKSVDRHESESGREKLESPNFRVISFRAWKCQS